MEELPHLITDITYILIVAGLVTIIFKRLKQPLVLGYIVAGFLAGPHMNYIPSITDSVSINEWSQIGVIFLMFSLGLEFSFRKVVQMGMRPIISALCIMVCMMSVGNSVGLFLGWGNMNRLFLGGMLAMSSTTIIYKAFEDLELSKRKFASCVLSVLVLEDILGILLMVILSAMAVSRRFEGTALMESMFHLFFFLILFFLVGIYLIPVFLRHNKKFMNSETLLIVSVGLCFLLVVIAARVGYSAPFGAFMMGSILSETVESERIERMVAPLRDLFGAIFFVSVGMLVDPVILVEHWYSILMIVLVVILGQMIFGTMSFLIGGNSLKDSIQSGFSMAQIGEFAFIIATLGNTLGVTDDFLYPIVVAVSIITTFFTPYMIKAAEPTYKMIVRMTPDELSSVIKTKFTKSNTDKEKKQNVYPLSALWKNFLWAILIQTAAYLTLCVAIIGIAFASLLPLFRHLFTHWPGNIVCGILVFVLLAPCIRPIVVRKNNTLSSIMIRKRGKRQLVLYYMVIGVKYCIGVNIVYYILNFLSPYWWPWHVLASMWLVYFLVKNKYVKLVSIRIERTFKQNLLYKEIERNSELPSYVRKLKGKDLHIVSLSVPSDTLWAGKTLLELHIGKTEHVQVVAIVRNGKRLNIPSGTCRLYPDDILEIVGDDEGIKRLMQRMKSEVARIGDSSLDQDILVLRKIKLNENSKLVNVSLEESNLRQQYQCMLVGIEDTNGNIIPSQPKRLFEKSDVLWVVGSERNYEKMKRMIF